MSVVGDGQLWLVKGRIWSNILAMMFWKLHLSPFPTNFDLTLLALRFTNQRSSIKKSWTEEIRSTEPKILFSTFQLVKIFVLPKKYYRVFQAFAPRNSKVDVYVDFWKSNLLVSQSKLWKALVAALLGFWVWNTRYELTWFHSISGSGFGL